MQQLSGSINCTYQFNKAYNLIADFRVLTTNVEKDKQNKTKSLKETYLVLQACKKEYQKLYLGHENLKKKNTKSSKRNCLNIKTIAEVVKQQTRLLRIERLNLAILRLINKN